MNNNNSRSINILLCIAGVLCCIGSGLVAAPKGLLADESINLVQTMQTSYMLLFYAIPSVLMLLACVLVIAGKKDILSLCSVLVAGVLSAMMDFQFGVRHQTFPGILFNMIGVILVAAGVALQVFATETKPAKVSRKAAKSRDPKEFRYERSRRPAYDDIYFDAEELAHTEQLKREFGTDLGLSEEEEYLALEAAEEAANAAAAQEQQEAEIEAMLRAFSMEDGEAETATKETAAMAIMAAALETPNQTMTDSYSERQMTKNVAGSWQNSTEDSDAEIEGILSEMLADDEKEIENKGSNRQASASTLAKANMAAALETPNQTMTDFYAGIEEIFLDTDNQ